MEKQYHRYAFCSFNWLVIIFLSAFALFAGGMIYILARSSEPLFFHWLEVLGFGQWLELLRTKILTENQILPLWLIYSLPSGLWAFAYSIIITGIWWNSQLWPRYFWFASIFILVIGWEILQLKELVRGTFSFGDILAGLLGAAIGIYIGIKLIKPKYHEKESV